MIAWDDIFIFKCQKDLPPARQSQVFLFFFERVEGVKGGMWGGEGAKKVNFLEELEK